MDVNEDVEDVLIREAEQLLPQIGRHMHFALMNHPATCGLPVAQIKALSHLRHHGQSTVGEVAHGVGLSMPAASELIEKLAEAGYVARAANPHDRRQVLVGLTPSAMELAGQIHALRTAQLRAAFDQLEPHERPLFVRSLRVFNDVLRLQAHELPGCPAEQEQIQEPAALAATRR